MAAKDDSIKQRAIKGNFIQSKCETYKSMNFTFHSKDMFCLQY